MGLFDQRVDFDAILRVVQSEEGRHGYSPTLDVYQEMFSSIHELVIDSSLSASPMIVSLDIGSGAVGFIKGIKKVDPDLGITYRVQISKLSDDSLNHILDESMVRVKEIMGDLYDHMLR